VAFLDEGLRAFERKRLAAKSESRESTPPPQTTETPRPAEPPAEAGIDVSPRGKPVDFEFPDLETGRKRKLSEFRGRFALVNFWASWCSSCADEAAALQSAWNYYQPGNQVVFLGVDYTDVESKALDYLTRFEITYPNGPDLGTRITPIFNRNIAMPETYIIDQRGILRYKQIGPFQSAAEIQHAIDALLGGG